MSSVSTVAWYPPGAAWDDTPIVLLDATAAPYRVLQAVQGLEAPTFLLRTAILPNVPGAQFLGATMLPRDVVLPVLIRADTHDQMRALKHELVQAMCHHELGPARVLFTDSLGTDSGDARYFNAYYSKGLEGDGQNMGLNWWRFTLTLAVLDPFWYSMEPATASWQGKPALPWFAPGIVMQFSEVGVDLVSALDLEGDADTYPEFTLQGPFLSIKATNSRTGEWWEVSRDTEASETVAVVSKPGAESLTLASGESVWGALSSGSVLFPLAAGDDIVWTVNGTSSSTLLSVAATPAWNTAP